jgi:hypothetical protein
VPFLSFIARTIWMGEKLRPAALNDLRGRAPSLDKREREVEIDEILRIYGGDWWPSVKRNLAEIRAIPTDDLRPTDLSD